MHATVTVFSYVPPTHCMRYGHWFAAMFMITLTEWESYLEGY